MSDSQDITCLCDLVEEANTIAVALGVVNPVLPNTLDQCVCYRAHVDEASHDGYLARRTPARTCTTLFFEKTACRRVCTHRRKGLVGSQRILEF